VYFPLAQGTAWSYDALDPGSGRTVLLVNRVQVRDANRAILAGDPDPLAYEDLGDRILVFSSRKPVLVAPIARGASWPLDGGGTATITSIDAAVETPGGRFASCVVVEEAAADRRVVTTYAPEIGPVKVEIYARGDGMELLVSRAVLRSYHKAGSETP
jgi:hypothetical protein